MFLLFFFIFQAEDGIRDDLVTGVQTCALPILSGGRPAAVTVDGVAHPWWQIEGSEFVGAEIDGPRAVTVELSSAGGDVRLDGRPVAGDGDKIRVDVPAGRHRLEVGLRPGVSRALLIRFRV